MDKKEKLKKLMTIYILRRRLMKKKLTAFMLIFNLLSSLKLRRSLHRSLQVPMLMQRPDEREVWKHDRSSTFWEFDVPKMDENRFRNNFRMSRKSFNKLCIKVENIAKRDTTYRPCIPLDKRVAIAIFALGSSAEYRTVAHLFGVGISTVAEIVLDFCNAVCENMADEISSYPPTDEELARVVDGFEKIGFPQCFGAVDGCHVEVQPLKEEAVDYYNYKGWYSVVLFAACDHRSKFTYINVGSPGRNNDSYIFEKSSLKRFHEHSEIFSAKSKTISNTNVPVLLIGDSAFRLSRYMMKPYPFKIHQPECEKTFNYHLSKCRRVIENAFGQLKCRFRKIGRGLQTPPKNCNIIIHACCLLHNFLKSEDDEISLLWVDEHNQSNTHLQPTHTTRIGNNDSMAKSIRDAIAFNFQLSESLGDVSGNGTNVVPDDDGVGDGSCTNEVADDEGVE